MLCDYLTLCLCKLSKVGVIQQPLGHLGIGMERVLNDIIVRKSGSSCTSKYTIILITG